MLVINCISVEIGRRWKDFARYIEVEEEEIEEIDCSLNLVNTRDKARRVSGFLYIYNHNCV